MFAGIDYSMSCPAICVHPRTEDWRPNSIRFHFLIDKKKFQGKWTDKKTDVKFYSHSTSLETKDTIVRGTNNAKTLIEDVGFDPSFTVAMEGYSFGSKGSRIFDIAEYTAMFKLFVRTITDDNGFEIYSPSMIKKFANGKGNAKKDVMVEKMIKDSGINLHEVFEIDKITAPINDLADAYWVCKLLHHNYYND